MKDRTAVTEKTAVTEAVTDKEAVADHTAKKHYDTFLIGHITVDEVQEVDGTRYGFFGGAELFSSYAAYFSGASVGILTKMTAEQRMLMDLLPFDRNDIYFMESKWNTSMLNRYLSEDRERRDLVVASVAEPFRMDDIPGGVSSSIYHLAGLVRGDFEDGMIEHLAKRGMVAVDMQGYLRCLDEETKLLSFQDYEHKKRDFPFIHFLKTDAAEAEILTGTSDREKAAEVMYGWGAKEVMITHNSEVMVYSGQEIYTAPLTPRNLSGRAGRGDTVFSVYITERLNRNIRDALDFAAAAVSLKMEQPGPLKKGREEIEQYRCCLVPAEAALFHF
ncbi:MAG: putative ribokinase [Bacillota bacterium]|nr:putative ribokinase [Bacillota bacterium]